MKFPLSLGLILFGFLSCNQQVESPQNQTQVIQTTFEEPPQWSKEVVWYQIFVERFRNGDTGNDPTPEDMKGTYPGFIPEGWKITPWTQDWYKPDSYWETAEKGKDFYGNPVITFGQKSQLRRYGGDLQGVLDQIDYIDSLGVTAIYFNPLNDAPSLHKYDARYWRHIDRNFGPDPRGDVKIMHDETDIDPSTWRFTAADSLFLNVLDEFHKRNIKVILDYSWNHTGHTFWAWKDLLENQENSLYKDWYWVKHFDDPETDSNEFEYRGWLGVHDLPEIKETVYVEHNDRVRPVEGNIYSEQAKQHIFNVTRRWLDPNNDGDPSDGVDGFRLDVAAEVPFGFWREFRTEVRKVNPDAYLVGEIWWEKHPDDLLDPQPFLEGDMFDAHMNYRWYRAARHFFNAAPDEIPVSEFVDSLNSFRYDLRKSVTYAMMNVAASHDAPRLLTSLFNTNKYKVGTNPTPDNNYKIHKPDEATYNTLKLLLAHQFTYIGAPHIWAGDEMGMWGSDDPHTRKPLMWPDLEFEDEKGSLYGFKRPADPVSFNEDIFNYYKKLIRLRNRYALLRTGQIDFTKIDDQNEVLVYHRYDLSDEIIVGFNLGDKAQQIEVSTRKPLEWSELLNDLKITSNKSKVSFELPPRSAAILIKKESAM